MSVLGIASSSLFNFSAQSVQNQRQQFRQEFQQLGQDLQAGNLSAAQADLATLEHNAPAQSASSAASSSTASQSSNPIQQAFNQLAQDLQSGNLTAAQQDYTNIQQNVQSQASHVHHRHHHGSGQAQSAAQNTISQLFAQLGQDLQSGNTSAALQAYNALQPDLGVFAPTSGTFSSSPASSGVVVSA
jgi:outer membrane protein assembly factor BamD (BamD/ComL family)